MRNLGWLAAVVLLMVQLAARGADTMPAAEVPLMPAASAAFTADFDEHLLAFNGSTGSNHKMAADSLRSALLGAKRDSATPQWRQRADAYWGLMNDPDQAIAQTALEDTLDVTGTSPVRAQLLLAKALNQKETLRMAAMTALTKELWNWKGTGDGIAIKDIDGLESSLRILAFDPDPQVAAAAGDLWAFLYPGTKYPMVSWRSNLALLGLIPGAFVIISLAFAGLGYTRRKRLELEFASPGPTVEQAVLMGKGMGYLLGVLGIAALLLNLWVIRGRAVGPSAGDVVQVASLVNMLAASLMIIIWSGNIQSGERREMGAMVRCCLAQTIMGAIMAGWMAMGFYHVEYLGGHPGPDILLAAGGAIITSCAGMLVAAVIWAAAARLGLEPKRQ